MKTFLLSTLFFTLVHLLAGKVLAQPNNMSSIRQQRQAIATEMERQLTTGLLDKWYPQCVDSLYGGYISTYTFDFKPTGSQDKFIVTQARHTWTTSEAYIRYPAKKIYLEVAEHGFNFLRDVMWDKINGGFYNLVTRQGKDKSNAFAPKEAYGNAFAIYALATYYKASKDTGALQLAKRAFFWLDNHAHDDVNKGYFQHLQMDGTPVIRPVGTATRSDLGYKDQNSSIHLLEALTALYAVWKNEQVRERLHEMLLLIRDTITTDKGNLTLFFTPGWVPVSFTDSSREAILRNKNLDHVSFGHDVETAYLMLEASHALGLEEDTKTEHSAKKMVDHALRNGWDNTLGGFYNEGFYFKDKPGMTIIFDSKNWWAQAEGLNTLLLMADNYPGDPMQYFEKFKQLWLYTKTYLIDHAHGDWYEEGLDKEPQRKTALKGHIWKGTYHHYRSMANCTDRLNKPLQQAGAN